MSLSLAYYGAGIDLHTMSNILAPPGEGTFPFAQGRFIQKTQIGVSSSVEQIKSSATSMLSSLTVVKLCGWQPWTVLYVYFSIIIGTFINVNHSGKAFCAKWLVYTAWPKKTLSFQSKSGHFCYDLGLLQLVRSRHRNSSMKFINGFFPP